MAGDIAAGGALDLQYVGSEPGQQLGACRSGLHPSEVDDLDSGEGQGVIHGRSFSECSRSGEAGSLVGSPGWRWGCRPGGDRLRVEVRQVAAFGTGARV